MTQNRRFQQGSLFKRGTRTKVWVARWREEVIGPDGKAERIRCSEVLGTVAEIPTSRHAKQLLSDRLRMLNSGDHRTQSTWTLKGFIQDRWLPDVLPTIKYSTQNHYKYIVKVHLLPTLGDMQLRLITRESVQSLLTSKRRSGLSWRTVKHIHTTFGTILAAAEMEGLIPDNPVRKTKLPRRGPIAEKAPIDPEKVCALLEALPEPSRSLAWLLTFTGLRIGELLALRWRDVDLEAGLIRVRQSIYEGHFDDPKTQRSRRTVPLGMQGGEILQARKPEACDPEGLVFAARNGSPLLPSQSVEPSAQTDQREVAAGRGDLALVATRECDPARFGRGFAETMQALLGHSSGVITREVYLHSAPADSRQAVQRVEELIGPKWTQVPEWPEMVTTVTQ